MLIKEKLQAVLAKEARASTLLRNVLFLTKNKSPYCALKSERKKMKIINRIFDLRISNRKKRPSSGIKKQISEIILLDRFEIRKESEKSGK